MNGSYAIINGPINVENRYPLIIIHKESKGVIPQHILTKIVVGENIDINQINIENYRFGDFDSIIDFILNIQLLSERQLTLTKKLQNIFINNVPDPSQKLFICMSLMVGSFRWINNVKSDFNEWVHSSSKPELLLTDTMCCYESVLYGLYLAGITSKEKIKSIVPFFKYPIGIEAEVYQQKISDLIIKDKKKTIPDFLEGPRRQTDLTIMKNILRMLTIMIPLGCESATAIDKTNMIQSRVNICFTIEKSISSTAIDMKESYIGHYFLVYKDYAIEIVDPIGSPVSMKSFTSLNSDYKTTPNTKFVYRIPFFGDINSLISNLR